MKPKIILWLYFGACIANIIAQIIPSEELDRYTKPLLMPLLLFYVYKKSIGNTTARVLLLSVAILFSWFGDVALMYQTNDLYFIAGIGLFLVAQITYTIVLRKATYQKPKFDLIKSLPFVMYGVLLFFILLPAGDFTIPVVVYGLVILLMMISAFSRKDHTAYRSYILAFIGSILFVLSDSILAVNAFKTAIPYAGFYIMSTYCAAQYLLAEGILSHLD